MKSILKKFERMIILVLMAFMIFAIFLSLIEVGVLIWQQLVSPPFLLLDVNEVMEVFGFILMVVIGLELLETIKAYFDKRVVHVEVVMLVALVAVARKIIIMDYKEITPQMILAVAALVISLSVGFYAVRRALDVPRRNEQETADD